MVEGKPTTMIDILRDAIHVGHTTLVLDEVAADHEMRSIYGVGLNDPIVIVRAPAKPEKNLDDYVSESHRAEAIRSCVAQGHSIEETWEVAP